MRNIGKSRMGPRVERLLAEVVVVALLFLPAGRARLGAAESFRRGDANMDLKLDMSDALATLGFLFLGSAAPPCMDAADSNDSGKVDMSDGLYTLSFLFSGGPAPPAPGPIACGPDPSADTLDCAVYADPACGVIPPGEDIRAIGHVLNRTAYGSTPATIDRIQQIGLQAYLQEQLNPLTIDEASNTELTTREDGLYTTITPTRDTLLVASGSTWKYFKGTVAPPANWATQTFNDAAWTVGATGIGYGDGDDLTVLADMQNGYMSVYLRRKFKVTDPAALQQLILRIDYDDGFVLYLNGTEVARRGVSGTPPAYNAAATSHDAGTAEEIDLSSRKNLLVAGDNTIAVQVHNAALNSSDLSMIPELIDRAPLPGEPLRVIKGINELKELLHIRGVYSRRQLQTVLAEFWENHFMTDFDKVSETFNALQNADGSDAMSSGEASSQAAQVKEEFHQFLTEHALGNFGDLLLASATDVAQLIYLDNYLNIVGNPNENYSREILELYGFGVSNRYTQKDIEQLAKCFTGWTFCKVTADQAPEYPASAISPPTQCGERFSDEVLLGLGAGWKYFKGTAEPSPAPVTGDPTTAWAEVGFNDAGWLSGSTGIGYGDNDDTTVLNDMRNNYRSVYIRKAFNVADPEGFANLILKVAYDDGFVAYINGVEVARSYSMRNNGSPPAFSEESGDHEASEGEEIFNLNAHLGALNVGTNILAIQIHNTNITSSDLTMRPQLVNRTELPGSIKTGDPRGRWTFFFDPTKHDTSQKILFDGTPYKITVPAGRVGMAGLQDALDPVRSFVNHPSTAEFICIKLIQKFVSDELTLQTYKDGTAPEGLKALLAECIAAWNSTNPKGDIKKVMDVILDPVDQAGEFWQPKHFGAKIKTPIEYVNSSLRALEGIASGSGLPALISDMGMNLLTRDEPDGFPEPGRELLSTNSMLLGINFLYDFTGNTSSTSSRYRWSTLSFLDGRGLDTAQEIVDFAADYMFYGVLTSAQEAQLLAFLNTSDAGVSTPLVRANTSDFQSRVQTFFWMVMSTPQWQSQ